MKATEILSNIQNRWHNVYWFSRMLINNDKYIAVGKEPKLLSTLASSLRLLAKESKGKDTLSLQKQTLRNIIEDRYKKTTSRDNRVQRMLDELDEEILRLMGLPIGDVYIHDRYLHMICEVFGKRVYIDKSSMLYRQHNANVLGSGLYTKRNSLLTKIRKTFTGDYVLVDQRDRGLMEQFYKRFKERMPLSSRQIFEDYFAVTDDTTPGKLKKILLLLKHRFAKPDLFIQLLFYRQKKGGKA